MAFQTQPPSKFDIGQEVFFVLKSREQKSEGKELLHPCNGVVESISLRVTSDQTGMLYSNPDNTKYFIKVAGVEGEIEVTENQVYKSAAACIGACRQDYTEKFPELFIQKTSV